MITKSQGITTPSAILLGCLMISLSILVSGGVIRLKDTKTTNPNSNSVAQAATNQPPQANPTASSVRVQPLSDKDHVRGNREARILLVEYSDLECPFCKRFHDTAQQGVNDYNGQVAWVYRHFPLDQLHPKARKEAEAAECANELGGNDGFWKMVDKIYSATPSNNGLNLDDLPNLASQIGLDPVKFKSCLDSGKYASVVEADYQSGIQAGVQGTPGNILLDTKTGKTIVISGAVPLTQVKAAIDPLLKS